MQRPLQKALTQTACKRNEENKNTNKNFHRESHSLC